MTRERLYLFDTTLRDGQQTQGVQFSTAEKQQIAKALDALGVDYIEGGWPGANPTDSEFFAHAPQTLATMTAFGMTKRVGRSAENDDVLAAMLDAGTPAVCLVGKTHEFHVTTALGVSLEENREAIRASVAHLVSRGREALFDAEHFFDGYRANPDYALSCLRAALEAGARWIVLCDTNGGTLPSEVGRVVGEVIAAGIPGDHLGIHCHDDTGNAVANSLAAVEAGARQIQGTLNGLGERCGNANLTTIIPTLLLKDPFASRFETGITKNALSSMVRVSRTLDDILNRVPLRAAPYVGASAFAHKAGLHASAILKDREDQGYAYDGAQASFELVARGVLGQLQQFFEVKRYRVTVERRKNKYDRMVSLSEAVVVVKVGDKKMLSVSESMDETGTDRGPVNALSKALAKDLGPYQAVIDDLHLVDFKVRITQGGTDAVTRVIIDSEDSQGRRWSTVGVSANLVDASFEALLDAINWKLIRDVGQPA